MGRSPCCVKEGLKKGPWTQEEDEKLIAFVKEHGHGNWRALPKKCGLLRCGKSCRLRWNNYLRPDIKRGLFTQSEEQKIFQLHALVGNKWAFIASQLPKRTDNEIKNYWNTVLKKRLQKENLNSFMSFGVPKMNRTLTLAAEKHTKSTQLRQDNQHGKSAGSASSNAASVMSCTHLAQWESARLEAEARLAKESQSSKKTHTPFSFTYMGHSFSSSNTASTTTTSSALSSLSNHTHTNPQSLLQLSTCLLPNAPPSNISTSCLIHHPSTIKPLFNSTLSLPAIVSMPPIRRSASDTSSTSSKSWSSLPSQESIASALILGRCGRLSWQAKELSFITSPARSSHTSQSSLISQLLCQIDGDDCGGIELQEAGKDGKLEANSRGQEELNLEATSSIVDLNSTMESSMDLTSHMENWHDFIFDVENSCSDVVSTSPIAMASPQGEQFTHDANSLISNNPKAGTPQGHMGLDLEGLNLFHFDSLMSCENYGNQHSNVLMKELLWDTPASVSISSTSIVN